MATVGDLVWIVGVLGDMTPAERVAAIAMFARRLRPEALELLYWAALSAYLAQLGVIKEGGELHESSDVL